MVYRDEKEQEHTGGGLPRVVAPARDERTMPTTRRGAAAELGPLVASWRIAARVCQLLAALFVLFCGVTWVMLTTALSLVLEDGVLEVVRTWRTWSRRAKAKRRDDVHRAASR